MKSKKTVLAAVLTLMLALGIVTVCACGEYSLSGGIPLCGYRRLDNLCSGRRNGDEIFNQGSCDGAF